MSERIDPNRPDDEALAEYLKGGSAVSQRYREISNDEVPADLDRRVLEMARGLSPLRKRRGFSPFIAPLALAASAVLVVSIVIESGVYKGEDPVVATQPATAPRAPESPPAGLSAERALLDHRVEPAPAAQAETRIVVQQTTAPAAARAEKAAEIAVSAQRAQQILEQSARTISVEQREFAATPAPAAAPQRDAAEAELESAVVAARREPSGVLNSPSPESVDEVAVTGARTRRDAQGGSGPRNTVRPAATSRFAEDAPATSRFTEDTDTPATDAAAPRTPEEWLEEIRDLRRQGRHAAADEEWARFRKSHPDYVVTDSDAAQPAK